MIHGKFGDNDELFFEIELIADEQLELPVDAMLDTGFSGWLAIDKQDSDRSLCTKGIGVGNAIPVRMA